MQVPVRVAGDIEQLQQCIRRERHAEQADRCHIALLATQGQQTQAIQQALTRSRGFVQRWAYASRDGGIEALRARPEADGLPSCLPSNNFSSANGAVLGDAGPDGQQRLQE